MPLWPRHHIVLAVLFALTVMLPGCFEPASREVRLGFVATFSGEGFRSGRDALEAARFAVDAVNATHRLTLNGSPCRVTLAVADDKASPEETTRAVARLVARDHVVAVIGPYPSDLADAAAKAAEVAGVPLVTPAATAAVVTAGRPHIFRIAFTDAFQGAVIGRLARCKLELIRVNVIANRDSLYSGSLSDAFITAFRQCGGQVRAFSYEERSRDFGDIVRRATADGPQALFLPNASKESVLLALAARKAGFTGLLLGGDAWDGPEVSRLAAFDGAYYVDHWREDSPGDRSRAYVAAFRAKRHHGPTELGALTQDAVDVVLAAVQKANSLAPEAVTKALLTLPPQDGVTGTFDFVDDGNPVKSLFIAHVADGASHIAAPTEPLTEPCR